MLVNWLGKVTFVACMDALVLITVLLPSVLGRRRQPQLVGMPQCSAAQRNLVSDAELRLIVGKLVADR